MKHQYNCRGNVLFIILITVALFAALSYAVSNSFRGGAQTITDEQARVAAGDILRGMQSIKDGYTYLVDIQGCSIDEVSFIKAGKEVNTNDFDAAIPKSDESCDIFNVKGAGIFYPDNLSKYQDSVAASAANQDNVFFFHFPGSFPTGSVPYGIVNTGTSANDHMIYLNFVHEDICLNINKKLNYDFLTLPTDDGPLKGDGEVEFAGKTAGCAVVNGINQIFFVIKAL